MSISYTEYRVTYNGSECIRTSDKRDAIAYIRSGMAVRLKGVYEIEHRMVQVGDWALTTKDDPRPRAPQGDYSAIVTPAASDRDQRDHA